MTADWSTARASVEASFEDSGEESYEPDGGEDASDDNDKVVVESDQEEKVEEVHETFDGASIPLSSGTGGLAPVCFDCVDAVNPNIVGTSGVTVFESDGKGEDDPAQAVVDKRKAMRVKQNLDKPKVFGVNWIVLPGCSELERLYLNVQESPVVYTCDLLDQMKIDGWTVLPDNVDPDIVESSTADKMYGGYYGPSKFLLVASKSPIELFYYFLLKSFWREVATHTNLYWQQPLEARLQKAEEKKAKITYRPPRSRAKLPCRTRISGG
ncbi:hypothetical protein PI125_g16362 [Phytophthora idaei]|nr:hypothetical protein PI125_g16362 [Phytophthora idaei]KAG3134560.1 hypothetical protein PI126_g18637 [Phytophthora idaei]